MSQIGHSAFDTISEEANGDLSSFISDSDFLNDMDLPNLSDDYLLDIPIAGTCYLDTAEQLMNSVEPNDLDQYIQTISIRTPSIESDDKRALNHNPPMNINSKEKKVRLRKDFIPLSQSVGVGIPQKIANASSKIKLVYLLEETFRPRYKSDYFAQNGKNRKPRYVADRNGNHFITIQVPVGIRGYIRIHWLTIADKSGDRYLMPYRFQQSNASANVPDCNPLDIPIDADKNGIMKLYLVLIKSKQDELKTRQPLQPFQPWKDTFNIPAKLSKRSLNPKALIKEYQLDQSQLAFTFCGLTNDGQNYIPEWDTTVYSTILRELPPESAKIKAVTCPQCSYQFDIAVNMMNGEVDDAEEIISNKRKFDGYIEKTMKKQNSIKNELVYCQ